MADRTRNTAAMPATAAMLATVGATATATGRTWKQVRWTTRMKADFLDALAQTCNIKLSAASIAVSAEAVYALRRRDPAFMADWDLALVQGYQVLETLLLGHVLAGGGRTGSIDQPEGSRAPALDMDSALRLLTLHRASITGIGSTRRGGAKPTRASDADTDAAILKKLDAIEKRRAA